MKIPKKLRMFGFNWKVIYDKNKESGDYNWDKKIIKIGGRYEEGYKVLFHELLEAVLTENLCRYYTNENTSDYQFIFNHSKFCNVVRQFAEILKDNKLI